MTPTCVSMQCIGLACAAVVAVVAKFGGEVLAKLVPDVAYTTYIRTFILMC